MLAQHIASNPEMVRRFVDEARAVNKIGHPNIVDIFSFGRLPDRRHYFVMEFLDGQSLAGRSSAARSDPTSRGGCCARSARRWRRRTDRESFTAISSPTTSGSCSPQHGDSYAKLLDFGIAKLVGDVDEGQRTQTGIVMGTPRTCRPNSAAA